MNDEFFGCAFTRRMWKDLDHILLIYVGSAAEFALVEENHWLFFTNKLPSAPWDRFTSTFAWNRKLVLSPKEKVPELGKTIRGFHDHVEALRSETEGEPQRISNEAFQAVGSMLIEYALLANAYLEKREVTPEEKEAYYQDQKAFFEAMNVQDLAADYEGFQSQRERQIQEQLKRNPCTEPLFAAYRSDLGAFRYALLKQFMAWFVPETITSPLNLRRAFWFAPFYRLFPLIRCKPVSKLLHITLLPKRVRQGLGEF